MGQTSTIGKTATKVFTEGIWTKVVYHWTCVIKWSNKQIVLDSNGWRTATTKSRINQAANQFGLGITVYQEKGNWFVMTSQGVKDFKDGMIIKR